MPERIGASAGKVLAVGGLDSSGGAGLTRDLAAIEAFGARPCLLATAFTLQPPGGPVVVHARDPGEIGHELRAALGASRTDTAVKVGMVASAAIARALVEALRDFSGAVVFDPVLRTSSGGSLYTGDPADLAPLLARATLVTPNADEAAVLSGMPIASPEQAERAAVYLVERGARAVLVKGGHLAGEAVDTLVTAAGGSERFVAPRLPGESPRGTGCALASAIAVGLARGLPLVQSIRDAKTWLWKQIDAAERPTSRSGRT